MTTYFNEVGWPSQIPESERKAFIQVNICSHFSDIILKFFLLSFRTYTILKPKILIKLFNLVPVNCAQV
jgi:hypothetical protein